MSEQHSRSNQQTTPQTGALASHEEPSPNLGLSNSSQDITAIPPIQPSSQQSQFTRSHPIAIRRSPNARGNVDLTSDDDDDEEDVNLSEDDSPNVERDAARLGLLTSRSLPSRLLRAPRLSSVPTNEDYLLYRNIPVAALPPPMSLHNDDGMSGVDLGAAAKMSYGSLRESNQQGRFFDGPSSYRDGRTGDIRRMVRFQATATDDTPSHSAPNNLSIRDRIQQSRQQRQAQQVSTSGDAKPTSSLAAMFDKAPREPTPRISQQPAPTATTFYENSLSALPTGALSTSLTGLEMLQRGLRLATITDQDSSHPSAGEEVNHYNAPNNNNNNNLHPAVLSRSLSDVPRSSPNYHHHHHTASTGTYPSPLSLGGPLVAHLSAALSAPSMPPPQPETTDPDREGAFAMDME